MGEFIMGNIHNWKRIVIWGASLSGSVCFEGMREKDIETLFFIDKYPPKSNKFKGKFVYNSEEIFENLTILHNTDAIILTMGSGASYIKNKLKEIGYKQSIVTYRQGQNIADILDVQDYINPFKSFRYDNSKEDLRLLNFLKDDLISQNRQWIFYGAGDFCKYFLSSVPEFKENILSIVDNKVTAEIYGIPVLFPLSLEYPENVGIFISATRYLDNLDIKHNIAALGGDIFVYGLPEFLKKIPINHLFEESICEPEFSIYPIDIPPIKCEPDLDMLLLDLPGRMLGMLPNGLGYVHNILKSIEIKFQLLDLDMIIYHRYHSNRILDNHQSIVSPTGREMPLDPWAIAFMEDSWKDPSFICYFDELLENIAQKIILAKPKIIGISLNGNNTLLVKNLVRRIKQELSDIKIVVGGYECINHEVGPKVFNEYDYMVIFEAEGSLPELIRKILKGDEIKNIPGVISKDDEGGVFIPADLENDLDSLGYPKYEWADIQLYKNYNGYQLVPILLSRGCKWSKCTFCGERFSWRRRSPQSLVDEIEFLIKAGCNNFHFNDSDLSGDPDAVRDICEEIIKRGITGISMAGQLRVQKGYTPEYFRILKKAGFNYLRYGIDGWSKNTLKLHKKGYTPKHISDVLKMTKDAGILVAINLVIGIPNETEEDIDETIQSMIDNAEYIDVIENINTLMLIAGSVYWEKPEVLGIRFRGGKNELYKDYPKYIPYKYWYSVNPYIDQDVRLSRLKRILDSADTLQLKIGSYAEWSSQNAKKI